MMCLTLLVHQVSPRQVTLLQRMADSSCNSNFFACVFHGVLEFHFIWIDITNHLSFGASSSFDFSKSTMPFFSVLRASRHLTKHLTTKIIGLGCCLNLFVRRLPDHVHPYGGFSLKIVNWVNPVHGPDSSQSPSTFQLSSMRLFCNIHCRIGPLGSIKISVESGMTLHGTYRLTLG